ncbi:hypothetical protein BaRGS_00010549 [Batillaria attramentaria]|uniref:Tyrosine-protein phosphatase non-receptor type 23 n=1 Tax=Batillaria attramentaria TaxID=370345 RepID=A0ABD0LFR4_9CAEN
MEAVPRLPMLAFELKHSPEYIDFGPTLKKYIRDHYGEDPALYNKAFSDLDQLRQNAIHVTRDFVGCANLKKYYAQLHYLNGRFPLGEGGEAAITFTWEDNQTGRDHIIADIKFEQACILYNIGALHSNLGAIDTRQNAEGMKVSCTHFQCAAWAFEHLRDHFGSSGMSTDMAHELLTFHINVMLAQAQECILEKSMIDSRKNTITAKVSAQVVEFYRQSVKNLDQCNNEQLINSRSYKDWKKRIDLKIAFYQCITHYYMGRQVEDQQKWGERLAYFQAAQDKLNEAVKLSKNEVPEMQEALRFAQDVVGGKLAAAQKDNDFIYHEKIPPIDSLPEVKGAPLVKGIPFDPTDPEISGPDIFQKLVPMEAHEASSVYSEEKAKLLRQIGQEVEASNAELDQFMASLQIDRSIFDQLPERLPQELLEKCAAMSVRTNAIKELVDSMSGVSGLATEAEMNIKEIQEMIAEDARKTEEFEQMFGKKMVNTVLPNLLKDCEGHMEKHTQGSQLNATLHQAMNAHITNLRLLVLPPDQLQAQLPPARPPRSPEDEAVLDELRRLLSKVDEMKSQRATLEQQFREQIQKDDITSVLVAQESSKESIYEAQLKKHDNVIGLIRQNVAAQSNILRALTDTNAKFAALRQTILQQFSKRETMVKDLINSFEKYEELLAKSNKGQDYYRKLNEAVMKTLERCRSECKVRQEERDMISAKYAPKVPPPSRPTAPKPGQPAQTPTPTSSNSSLGDPALDPGPVAFASHPTPPAGAQAPLPTFEGPKLKDFLPFMKPQSFGPKRTSSPQSLPPGSPDPAASGPPSIGSSSSGSPQHRPHPNMPHIPPELMGAIPPGVGGHYRGMPDLPPDITAAAYSAAKHSRPDGQAQYPYSAPPPDVTANLPVAPAPGQQHSSLPDVSSHPSQAGHHPQHERPAHDGYPTFPPTMPGHMPGASSGYSGGDGSPGRQLGTASARTAAGAGFVPASSASMGPSSSFQQGYVPGGGGTDKMAGYGSQGASQVTSSGAGFPQNIPSASQPGMPTLPGQQTHQPQSQMPPHQRQVEVPPQQQLPMHGGHVPTSHSQQPMVRPSPAPSPAQSLSPAPSPGPTGYQMHQHVPGGYNVPSQPAMAPGGLAGQGQFPGQQYVPQTGQHGQMAGSATPQVPGQPATQPITSFPSQVSSQQQSWGAQAPGVQGQYNMSTASAMPFSASSGSQAMSGGQGIQSVGGQSYPPTVSGAYGVSGQFQSGQQAMGQFGHQQGHMQWGQGQGLVPGQSSYTPTSRSFQLSYSGQASMGQASGQFMTSVSSSQPGYYLSPSASPSPAQASVAPTQPHQQQYQQYQQPYQQPRQQGQAGAGGYASSPQGGAQTYTSTQQIPPGQGINQQRQGISQQAQGFNQQGQGINQQGQGISQQTQLNRGSMGQVQGFGQQQQYLQQGQQPPQQQQQRFPQYPAQSQPQQQPQQFPPESQLIFPTPLQPSRVQSVDNLPPRAPTPQQGVVQSQTHPQSPSHGLAPQGQDATRSLSAPTVQNTHAPGQPAHIPHQNQLGPSTGPGLTRQESSLDELLSSSPEGSKHTAIPAPIITPKVLTDQEKQQQKEEAVKKGAIVEKVKDPYENSSVLNKFVSDVEAFGKFVDDLSISILGVSRLDTVWKSLIDSQDHDVKKQSIAIARCYPMKNRDPDIMPYDETRVVLSTTKDDYVNASWINDLAPSCPKFVATQAPLSVTMTDFWAMVYELGSEVIVQITSEYETGKKFPVYFPTEKGQQMEQGPIILNLQSVKYRQLWTERNVYLKHSQTKQGRTVIHLQFKTWPVSGFPDDVQHVLRFISEVHSFYQQQRSLLKPVIVHCGACKYMCTALAAASEMLHGNGLIDVPALAKRMLQKRKNIIHKKEQLKFCYDALLCFAEDFLKKRNILVQHPHFEKKRKIAEPSTHHHGGSSSDDIVLGSVNLRTLQQTVGRLHVHAEGDKPATGVVDESGQTFLTHGGGIGTGHSRKDSDPVSALPDLIQQPSRSDSGLGQIGSIGSGTSLGSGQSAAGATFINNGGVGMDGGRPGIGSPMARSRSGSNTSQRSMSSMAESGSSRASPQHGPSSAASSTAAGGVSQALADLQDPSKFTLGKGEQKKRITKETFERKGSGAGLDTSQDPADPLSSLDPMWTIHKPKGSEKK